MNLSRFSTYLTNVAVLFLSICFLAVTVINGYTFIKLNQRIAELERKMELQIQINQTLTEKR